MRQLQAEQLFIQIRQLQENLSAQSATLDTLQGTVIQQGQTLATLPGTTAPVVNVIRDSDFNYSKLAYTGTTPNTDCAHWYKHFQYRLTDGAINIAVSTTTLNSASARFTTVAFGYGTVRAVVYGAKADGSTLSVTLTRVSDTSATMSAAADVSATNLEVWFGTELNEAHAQALETTATNYAAWSKSTSIALIGGTSDDDRFTIDQPLATNSCTPSSRQYFQINAKLATGFKPVNVTCYVGIWDATAGRQRWLEGDNFALTATKVGPHTGGTTSRTYRVIATTDYGFQLQSEDFPVTNTIDPLTTGSYVALSWTDLVGILTYDVYMYDGTNTYLVTTINNGSSAYFDDGPGIRLDRAGFPSITATRWRAFVEFPANQFNITTDGWIVLRGTIAIPQTYAMSLTTGKQWLRFGLVNNAGALGVQLDHASLCAAPSNGWNISILDSAAVSAPDGNSDNDDQGGTGQGGPVGPIGGGINGNCIHESEPVSTPGGDLYWPHIKVGTMVDDGFGNYQPIQRIERVYQHSTAIVTAEDGATIQCSLTHPLIHDKDDYTGRIVFKLQPGDDTLTNGEGGLQSITLTSIVSGGAGYVLEISMNPNNPRFLAGKGKRKFVHRNTKIQQQGNPF